MLPVNDNDSLILSWTKPDLTDDNREYFQGFDVSITRTMLNTTLSQRRKRNIPASESQFFRLASNEINFIYSDSCPYSDSTLCPYSQYCFSVVSVFEFRGIPIDTSDPTLTTMCTFTSETGEFVMFTIIL